LESLFLFIHRRDTETAEIRKSFLFAGERLANEYPPSVACRILLDACRLGFDLIYPLKNQVNKNILCGFCASSAAGGKKVK
jgi:hypothetical protein